MAGGDRSWERRNRDMERRAEERALVRRLVLLRTGQTDETATLHASKNELFARYRRPLASYCTRIVGSSVRGEELAQDVMDVAWRKLESFDADRGSFGAWLYGIARFKSLRAVEKRGDVLVEDGIFDPADDECAVWRDLHKRQRLELLLAAIDDLAPQEQEAIYLRYYEEMPIKRITEELGIEGRAGARGLLQRCRRHLTTALRVRMQDRGIRSSFFVSAPPSHG